MTDEVKTAEELYKQYIKELSEEAIPPTLNENVENTENTIISNLTARGGLTALQASRGGCSKDPEAVSENHHVPLIKLRFLYQCYACWVRLSCKHSECPN